MMMEGNVLLVTADNRPIWPFPSVNGQQTEASKALQALPPEPKLSLYETVMSDPELEECLL